MASKNYYNAQHYWSKKLPKYLSEAWSRQPSPFAQIVANYLPTEAVLLELGTGAGQDGLWLSDKVKKAVLSDAQSLVFPEITKRAKDQNVQNVELVERDITQPFRFADEEFDVVYAQLVLHYFDDDTMHAIVKEIRRVLKPAGIFACMVNSVNDPEYNADQENEHGLINVDGLMKRYFNIETFRPFLAGFEPLLFDMNGKTPKDDAVSNSGMVQFIGKKS